MKVFELPKTLTLKPISAEWIWVMAEEIPTIYIAAKTLHFKERSQGVMLRCSILWEGEVYDCQIELYNVYNLDTCRDNMKLLPVDGFSVRISKGYVFLVKS